MSDDWVHPPGWDPKSKAKAAAERKEKTFFQKYRYCLIPIVLGAIAGLSVTFLFQETITFNRGTKSSGTLGLEFLAYGMAFSLTMAIVIRLLDGISRAESIAPSGDGRKSGRRYKKYMWAFVPMILAILIFLLMIPVTLITGDVGSLGIAVMWILLAAALTVLILVILFVTSLFDAAEKRSRRPPTD